MVKKLLTKQEEKVMELFWKSEVPLTSRDVVLQLCDTDWSGSYVYSVLRALSEKGLITECGRVRGKSQYMREYCALFTEEEYFVRLAYENHVDAGRYIKLAVLDAVQKYSPEAVGQWVTEVWELLQHKTKNR